jgi:hypothetical protein
LWFVDKKRCDQIINCFLNDCRRLNNRHDKIFSRAHVDDRNFTEPTNPAQLYI